MLRNGTMNNYYKQGMKLFPAGLDLSVPRQLVVGVILILALLAFETFNFDSTRFALNSLLGGTAFLSLTWATILAIAFCAIDFAGLAHLFTPQRGADEPREVWFLMGAWLLGATMNAIMTWWAVSLALLNHDFGNEILNRQQLLTYVPIFVAILVWLTRILFIGAFSVAGDHFFRPAHAAQSRSPKGRGTPSRNRNRQRAPSPAMATSGPGMATPSRRPGSARNLYPPRQPLRQPPRPKPQQPGLQASPPNNH